MDRKLLTILLAFLIALGLASPSSGRQPRRDTWIGGGYRDTEAPAGALPSDVQEFHNAVGELGRSIGNNDFFNLLLAEEAYKSISKQNYSLVSKSVLATFEDAKEQAANINHTYNGFTITGIPWNVILYVDTSNASQEPSARGSAQTYYSRTRSFAGSQNLLKAFSINLRQYVVATEDPRGGRGIPNGLGLVNYTLRGSGTLTVPYEGISGYKDVVLVAGGGSAEGEKLAAASVASNSARFAIRDTGYFGLCATKRSNNPKTGDATNLALHATVAFSALSALYCAVIAKKIKDNG